MFYNELAVADADDQATTRTTISTSIATLLDCDTAHSADRDSLTQEQVWEYDLMYERWLDEGENRAVWGVRGW